MKKQKTSLVHAEFSALMDLLKNPKVQKHYYCSMKQLKKQVQLFYAEVMRNSILLSQEQRRAYHRFLEQDLSSLKFRYSPDFIQSHLEKYGEAPDSFSHFQNEELKAQLKTKLYKIHAWVGTPETLDKHGYISRIQKEFLEYGFERKKQEIQQFLFSEFTVEAAIEIFQGSSANQQQCASLPGPQLSYAGLTANQVVLYADKRGIVAALEDDGNSSIARDLAVLTGLHPKNLKNRLEDLENTGNMTAAYKKDIEIVDAIIRKHKSA